MRIYKTLTREFLSQYTDALRKRLDLTQEKMAESLRITYRAYGDLERGKYCFSAASLLFLLLLLEDEEVLDLLKGFHQRVSRFEHETVLDNSSDVIPIKN